MNTDMKENTMTELTLKNMERVCGGGFITGYSNLYSPPVRKSQKGKTENEQNDQ